MRVVSNSTPLIALSKINQLALLKEYFSEVYIPKAVYREVVVQGGKLYGAEEVNNLEYIKVKEVKNRLAVKSLMISLDEGEAEAIILTAESKANLLLIDDADGRKVAQGMDLKITGTVGILLMAAKDKKLDLKNSLNYLLAEGFRLSEKEYQRILKLL
ncbi:MAG: DUF3368 domain-containing protein [Nitrospinae bacterium]|nr:DUF3368 domain-containing protein [Nitrospinota bacterium]